jgi:hypothetical protein
MVKSLRMGILLDLVSGTVLSAFDGPMIALSAGASCEPGHRKRLIPSAK